MPRERLKPEPRKYTVRPGQTFNLKPEHAGWKQPYGERRCPVIKRDGTQCNKWKVRGCGFCDFHERKHRAAQNGPQQQVHGHEIANMARIYRKVLTKTLADALAEQTGVSPAEQLQIYEELALLREHASLSVQMYAIAREALAQKPESNERQAIVASAGQTMAEQLKAVVSVCETAARIDANAKDKLSIPQLQFFVNQIVVQIHNVCNGDKDIAAKIEAAIRNNVKLPSFGSDGTTITPDADVVEMDSTVPKIVAMETATNNHLNGVNGHASSIPKKE